MSGKAYSAYHYSERHCACSPLAQPVVPSYSLPLAGWQLAARRLTRKVRSRLHRGRLRANARSDCDGRAGACGTCVLVLPRGTGSCWRTVLHRCSKKRCRSRLLTWRAWLGCVARWCILLQPLFTTIYAVEVCSRTPCVGVRSGYTRRPCLALHFVGALTLDTLWTLAGVDADRREGLGGQPAHDAPPLRSH